MELPHLIKSPKQSKFLKARESKKGTYYVLVYKLIKDKEVATFITDITILDKKKEWNPKTNTFVDITLDARRTKIENDLNLIITKSILEGKDLSPKQLIDLYKPKRYELPRVWERYILEVKKSEYDRGEITKESFMKYVYRLGTITKILTEMKEPKFPLDRVNTSFCRLLENNLRKIGNANTINRYAHDLMNVMDFAVVNELTYRNPINKQTFTIKPKKEASQASLTAQEIALLATFIFGSEVLGKARDLFLFLIYTGMRHSDGCFFDFSKDTIRAEGKIFIQKSSQKTTVDFTVPLFPEAYAILKKYDFCLPNFGKRCDRFNRYLREIQALTGIKQRLHSHLGRKTFANILHNENKIDFDTTSKTLGHTRPSMTEKHYATENRKRQVINATAHLAVKE